MVGRGKTKFMLDNYKRKMLSFLLFLGKQTRKSTGNTNNARNNISMQNKLDVLFQPSQVIGRPNHSIMEYFLPSRCNHKARLDDPKAYRLAWHPWLDSGSWILFGRYDSVHGELFTTEPNIASQIKLFIF